MNTLLNDYYKTLFESGEQTCFGYNKYATAVCDVFANIEDNHGQFLSINPMVGKRADTSVTCFRNILVEFDKLPLLEQKKIAENFPHSTCVFSGGKSYHYIISLKTPCADKKEYDNLVRRVYKKLPDVDSQGKNPSRFTRMPNGKRENGVVQSLEYVTGRISRQKLEEWLGPEEVRERFLPNVETYKVSRLLSGNTMNFLLFGAEEGSRNSQVFKHSCEMFRAGYTEEEIINKVTRVIDLQLTEIISAVKSAAKTVRNQ